MGRKAYLFAASGRGGEVAATMYSLVATCKLNRIEPFAYLKDVLGRIRSHRVDRLAVYGILCKRVFCLMRQHAIFELNREAVQGSFPVMNGHGPFPANVV